jgi:tRNA U34 2-thiouridine synthase MnmA/TrmU
MTRRAIALISGGLDSLLAARVVMDQGIEVEGVSFVIGFASKDNKMFERNVKAKAVEINLPLRIIDISKVFLEVLRAPKHGYGANINPCIDCKTLMLRKAKEIMEKEGFDFIITGEVLGQRPMSQRRDALNTIKNHSGLGGRLLRPLCAKMLDETIPEKEGIVDRSRLFDIRGRSRKQQMELAERYGLKDYAQPAGGCLLTDPGFAARIKDLMAHGDLDMENVNLAKTGRHFRIGPGAKVVLGRDDKENNTLMAQKIEKDVAFRLFFDPGPYALLRGEASEENVRTAASLVVSHSKKKNETSAKVEFWVVEGEEKTITVSPMGRVELEKMRI